MNVAGDYAGGGLLAAFSVAAALLITRTESDTLRFLEAAGFACESRRVVVVAEKHRQVSASRLGADLRAAGIELVDAYRCSSHHNGSFLVLKTSDNARTAERLKASAANPGKILESTNHRAR